MSNVKGMAKIILFSALIITASFLQAAEFTFTFDKQPGSRGLPGGVNGNGSTFAGNDGTRFLQSTVNIGGIDYIQTIVGNEALGFGIESYTTGSALFGVSSTSSVRPFSPDVGGMERALIGTQSEVGTTQNQINRFPGKLIGNAKDPFGTSVDPASGFQPYDLTGNGTGSPDRMTMRMYLRHAGLTQEVYKPLLSRKPRISQDIKEQNEEMRMSTEFVADMRVLNYAEADRAAPITNRVAITDLAVNEEKSMPNTGAGDFDMTQAQDSVSSAGRYTFTPGTGWNDPAKGWDVNGSTFDEGSYAYIGSTYDVFNTNWASFFSAGTNAKSCATGNRRFSDICQ